MTERSVTGLVFGKAGDELCARAAEYLRLHWASADVRLGRRGDPFPSLGREGSFDYIISYLSPWIIPEGVLSRATCAAINFHPGPPEYPGIGCTNFAIYEGATLYGVTCHHMKPKVDSGPLIRVVRFPLYSSDTVLSLTHRCYAHLACLFYEIVDLIMAGQSLPMTAERWTRRPFRRSDLDELCRLTPGMNPAEVQRRIHATTFPGYPNASFDWPDASGPAEKTTKRCASEHLPR